MLKVEREGQCKDIKWKGTYGDKVILTYSSGKPENGDASVAVAEEGGANEGVLSEESRVIAGISEVSLENKSDAAPTEDSKVDQILPEETLKKQSKR